MSQRMVSSPYSVMTSRGILRFLRRIAHRIALSADDEQSSSSIN